MFWVRSEIIVSFFKRYNALKIRATLENGNVLDNEFGTKTHAWERMLSWIAGSQGYYIQGI
jgi:lipopolysaccharide biosynthesis protein